MFGPHYNRSVFLLLFMALVTGKAAETFPQNGPGTTIPANLIPDPVIELAIFYDAEFASRFDNNPRKIQNYFEVVIYDLHLRFQTLKSFSTSFRVTSINLFERPSKPLNVPIFHIGILAHGPSHSEVNQFLEKALHGSVCQPDCNTEEKNKASAIVSLQADPSLVEILGSKIALLLGAPMDDDPTFLSTCESELNSNLLCCIMRTFKFPRPKFFSECTDMHLTRKLAQLLSTNKFCLYASTPQANPIIDSVQLFENPARVHGYTFTKQCQILLHGTNADFFYKSSESDECLHGTCWDRSTNQKLIDFSPLEASRCGEQHKGRCFRGLCIQHQFKLANVATGKCLVSEKGIFGFNDKPVLQKCSSILTQMFAVPGIMRCCNSEELVLQIPYSVSSGASMKRFSTNLDNMKMMFCSKETSKLCRDTFVQIHRMSDTDGKEFVLEVGPGWYMKATEDGINVDVTIDGTGNDKTTRWKLLELVKGAVDSFSNCDRKCKAETGYSRKSEFKIIIKDEF